MTMRAVAVKGQIVASILVAAASSAPLEAENWPCFRGPQRQGISRQKDPPTEWGPTENIVWRQTIPGRGWSSPIVWDDRVYVTTATDDGASLHVICLAGEDGDVVWNTAVPQKAGHKLRQNSYATPTPCTDGRRVYVLAADGRIVALSTAGEIEWINAEFDYYSQHGVAVSPILHDELVIVPFDWSSRGPDKKLGWQRPWAKAFIMAVNKATGKTKWTGKRGNSRIAHVTPVIVEVDGRDQLVSSAGDVVQGFDPRTGQRLWSVPNPGEGVVPSPAAGDGMVFATSGFGDSAIRAVRLGGPSDATDTHILWTRTDDVPKVPSLLFISPHLYILTDSGVLTCVNAAAGDVVWRERLAGKFSASPIWADGKIYVLDEQGRTTVLRDGGQFEVVARNPLEGTFCATPAIARGRIYLRSDTTLYCIGP
jgi:outer membrane protein assembly factor BamB